MKMKKDYWLQRWEREETGFHKYEINSYLHQHWQALHLAPGSEVFVPLCGKSRDMSWLSEQGYPVLGVELSAIAVQAFFQESGRTPQYIAGERFDRYEMDGIRVLCGDFFALGKDDLSNVKAVYDRAALVALPPETRELYVRHLLGILPPATQILLLTFDYPQPEMPGPPFAVSLAEVETLYHGHAAIRLLAQRNVLAHEPRFQERGLSRLEEGVVLLTLHG
jgi:thiopurine S-methyltransferase